MRQRAPVNPSPEAQRLGREMVSMRDVMREVLDETIPHPGADDVRVHESGRTVCGPGRNVVGPLARFPTSVKLDQCPRGVTGGTWHTHVTKDQLRYPNNSLPDTANVVFGEIDASVVVGTREAEMVVAAQDREYAIGEFQDALGAEVESTEDVIDAIVSGHVPNPPKARERVKSRLGALFSTHRTQFGDLDTRLDQSGIPASAPGGASIDLLDAQFYANFNDHAPDHTSKNPWRDPQGFRNWARAKKRPFKSNQVTDVARDTTVSVVVGRIVRGLLP